MAFYMCHEKTSKSNINEIAHNVALVDSTILLAEGGRSVDSTIKEE
jgi:hypothetical protein